MLENEEFPGRGGARYYEPALKIARDDGDRDLVLRYASHRIQGDNLDITLKDIDDPIEVTLHYRVYPDYGILSRSATVRNGTSRAFTFASAQSAAWYLPPGEGYRLSYLSGRWAAETQLDREPIHEGQKVLESRKGHTSHNFNPWFAVDAGDAAEEHGRVWFGALAWSGNWRLTVEQTPYRQVARHGRHEQLRFRIPSEALGKPGDSAIPRGILGDRFPQGPPAETNPDAIQADGLRQMCDSCAARQPRPEVRTRPFPALLQSPCGSRPDGLFGGCASGQNGGPGRCGRRPAGRVAGFGR
jgi:hypothetical protein